MPPDAHQPPQTATPRRPHVAVIGAGVAGLTLAASLDAGRFDVTLHEAQPRRTTGAALGLWPEARRELSRLGVSPRAARDARVSIHRLDGRRLAAVRSPAVAQVRRPELMAALWAALPPTVALVTHEVERPAELDADVVVGADGVRSRVRGLVHARSAERVMTPWVALRGMGASVLGEEGVAREFWGPARLYGDAPAPDGRYWFTSHRSDLGPEPLDVATVRDEARVAFADAHPSIGDVLAAADDHTLATRLWVTPPLPRYVRGRYVVVGDAAHGALPNLGRGASDAVIDAVTLAATLNRGGSLVGWQARRVPVTQAARLGAGVMMRLATSGVGPFRG